MRNRFKNSTTHIYEAPVPNVTLTLGNASAGETVSMSFKGAVGDTVKIIDSYDVETLYTFNSNGSINNINIDAHLTGSTIELTSSSMSRFWINGATSEVQKIEIHREGSLTDLTIMANGRAELTEFVSVDLPNVTNMSQAFRGTSITSFPNIDVSGVIDVSTMFYNCSELTAINADFSNVTVSASGFTYGCDTLKCLGGITTFSTTDTTSNVVFGSPILVTPTEYEKDQIINNPNGYSYVKPAYLSNCSFGLFELDLVRYSTTDNISIRVYGLTSDISCTVVDTTGTSTVYTATTTFLAIDNIDVSGASDTIKITMPNISRILIRNKYVKEIHILNGGTLKSLASFNSNYGSYVDTLTSVPLHYVDTVSGMLYYNTSLTTIPTLDLPFCRDYNNFLRGSSITSFPSNWVFDVATNLEGLFYGCTNLTSLSQLDFPRGKSFREAFYNCTSLTSFTGITFSQVTGDIINLYKTWMNCTALTSMPTIDLSKVNLLGDTWNRCSALTSFPNINTSTITSLDGTWNECSSLTSFPSLDFSAVTYCYRTWRKCTSLLTFPATNFPALNTTFQAVWEECYALTSFPLITITFSGATPNVSNAWYRCESLTSFPAIDFTGVKNFASTWYRCYDMTSWGGLNLDSATRIDYAFDGCTSLTSLTLSVPNATTVSGAFRGCTLLTDVNDGTGANDSLDVSSAISLSSLFQNCTSMVTPPILDVSSATSAFSVFSGCTNITHIKGLGTAGNVGGMTSMFYNCSSLICLDALDGTSSSVGNTPVNVFNGCTSLVAPNSTEQTDILDNNVNWVNANPCPNPHNGITFTLTNTDNLGVNVDVDQATTLNLVHSDGSLQDISVAAGSTTLITLNNDGNNSICSVYSPEITSFRVVASSGGASINITASEILDTMKLNSLYQSYKGNYLTSFISVGLPNVTTIDYAFQNSDIASFICPDLSGVTTAILAFRATDITTFTTDLPNCTDITSTWELTKFVTFPTINLNSVVTATGAWNNISTLQNFLLTSFPSCTTLDSAWASCSGLTTFPTIVIPLVTSLYKTWSNCGNITSFPTILLPEVLSLRAAWENTGIASFPVLQYPKVTNIQSTWEDCASLISFPTSNFLLVTNGNKAWDSCTSLTTFNDCVFSSSIDLSQAWSNCSSMTTFNVSSLSTATNLYHSWAYCTSLVTQPLIDISAATNLNNAWQGCTALTTIPLWVFSSSLTDLDNTWQGCSALTSIAQVDTSNITSLNYTFQNCTSLTSFPVLNFSSVTKLRYTFNGCTSLTAIPDLSLELAADVYNGFRACTALTTIQSSIGTNSNANKSFVGTFQDCTNLTCIQGISTLETGNTPSTTNMFVNTPALIHPDATEQTALTSATGATYSYTGTC